MLTSTSSRRREIVVAARALVEERGTAALTMRQLAERLGVKAPSLYKHVAGKDELEAALVEEALDELARALIKAGADAAGDPLGALAGAYRDYALAHPHLYRLVIDRSFGDLERRAAGPLIEATGDPDRARALWAFAHGMAQLTLTRAFPPDADLETAWREGLAGFGTRPAPTRTIVRSWRGPD